MTEIKISEEELGIAIAAGVKALLADETYGDLMPLEYTPGVVGIVTRAAGEALVASGWRREAPADGSDPFVGEALADPVTRMAYRSGVDEQFAAGLTTSGTLSRVIADAFRRRASEAEQYVSAGTPETKIDYGRVSASDIESVAYMSGGGIKSIGVYFEPVDEDVSAGTREQEDQKRDEESEHG
jgi:hypothetical protein